MFTTDSHFLIGDTHLRSGKPCQDYATSGVLNGAAFAIAADGCSTGGNTDVGSRVLALSTASAIREYWAIRRSFDSQATPAELAVRQKAQLASAQTTLGLVNGDMLATCAYALVTPSGGFVHLQGDGVVALKTRSGIIRMWNFDWEGNMPYYPAYQSRIEDFIGAHGGDVSAVRLWSEHWLYEPEAGFTQQDGEDYSLGQGIRGVTLPLDEPDLEYVAVFSDGAAQVEDIDWKDAVLQLLAFKTATGEFATRRMNRFVKDAQKQGKGPLDDIACAIIHVAPPDDQEEA